MTTQGIHEHNGVLFDETMVNWDNLTSARSFATGTHAVFTSGLREPYETIAQALRERADILLVASERFTPKLRDQLLGRGYTVWHDNSHIEPTVTAERVEGRITITTSGTTGEPKFLTHNTDTLRTMQPTEQPARRWLNPYSPGTYAWYQCVFLSLFVPGQSLVPVNPAETMDWTTVARRANVNAVSATPTFWRRSLVGIDEDALRAPSLSQITLGGERIDQSLLDRLRSLYPHARITHIYAASEVGAVLAVHDGIAGFPAAWLNQVRTNKPQLRIEDDRLFVLSQYANTTDHEKWVDTGDVVRVVNDRVFILGRADHRFLNVGGTKVDALAVEHELLRHPDVMWASVKSRRAPIVGEVVTADVVATPEAQLDEASLRRWCEQTLSDSARPRIIRVLETVPATSALKAVQ